jgi:hydroxymethylbilane synthase
VPPREDPRDALCGAPSLADLPAGARVGTSSLRRRAQLAALRPELEVVPLRGNVDTRLRRLEEGACDALVLAAAGLRRLGREDAAGALLDELVPCAGQGALALETRADDEAAAAACGALDDRDAARCLAAERALVRALGASCHTPLGAHARLAGAELELQSFLGLPDGGAWLTDSHCGPAEDPEAVGTAAAERLLAAGAAELLRAAEEQAAT